MLYIEWANVFGTITIVGAVFLAVWFVAYGIIIARENDKEVRPNVRRK